MNTGFVRKPAALAAIAAATAAVAVVTEQKIAAPSGPPAVAIAQGGGWEQATATVLPADAPLTGCTGVARGAGGAGVAVHPALPCGTRIVLSVGTRYAIARIAGHGPVAAGASLGLGVAVARQLRAGGGAADVRWALAR